jgi:hypothetical protein
MRKLNRLLMAALVLTVPLAACDEGDETITPEPTPPAVGTVSGTVTVQGEGGVAGITVQLAGASAASTTTGSDGSFSFANVVEGNYSVAISGIPADFTFQNTTQSVTINQDGQTASVSFSGQVVRTASISGSVSVNGTGFSGVAVTINGPEGQETKTSGSTGTFQFTGLRSGDYTVTVTNPDPDTYTFSSTEASINLAVGESEVVEFTATEEEEEEEPDPAEISINSITQGGDPITLSNVMGQIEVAVNVRRNGNTLDRVEIVIDDEVVAAQQFADLGIDGPAQQDDVEEITLNVPTDQVRMNGDIATPVLFNGGAEVSALLYVVGETAPLPSNEVPIVLNNPDYVVAADLMYSPLSPDGAQDVDGDTWFGGNTQFTADFFLPFSGVQPEWIEFEEDGGSCSFDVDESSVTGGLETGWTVVSSYDCTGGEGPSEIDNDIESFSYGDAVEGPDGTDLRIGESMARLGAEFMLDGETRRFLRTGDVPVTLPDELLVDNTAPSLFIYGDETDTPPGAGADLQVAYNVEFDQWWVQSDFAFESTVWADAAGTVSSTQADDGVGIDMFEIRVYNPEADTCDGDVVARAMFDEDGDPMDAEYPTTLDQTLTSDETNGHILCVVGSDRLGNMISTTAADESNYFGVDDTPPVVRIWGNTANAAVAAPPSPSPYAPDAADPAWVGTTPVSADLNTTIYGETVDDAPNFQYIDRDVTMGWGMDALDNRAGLDDLPGQPFSQTVDHASFDPEVCPAALDTDVGTVLSDTWVRIDGTGTALDCGIGEAGIFTWTGMVQDRAGNMATVGPFNYLIDDDLGGALAAADYSPDVDAVTLGQGVYTPGMAGTFGLFGSDNLENTVAQSYITYPNTAAGTLNLWNLPQALGDRWDDDFSLAVLGTDDNPILTATPYGRIDFTDGTGDLTVSPVAGNLPANFNFFAGTDPDLAEDPAEDEESQNADMLPGSFSADIIEDAGLNPSATGGATIDFIDYALGGWTTVVEEPWTDADIEEWVFIDDTSVSGDWQAVHAATTSIDSPFFDAVLLVHNDGATPVNITICGAFPAPVETDNGVNRFYTYSWVDADVTGTPCEDLVGGTYHAVGVSGSALLVTLENVPNPVTP